MAGETVTHSSEDGTTNNGKYNICNWFYDSTSPYTVTTLYNEEYGAIEATNIAIKNLNMMPETTKRNSLLGEALALRAFAYLNLISIYGSILNVRLVMSFMTVSFQTCRLLQIICPGSKKVVLLLPNV